MAADTCTLLEVSSTISLAMNHIIIIDKKLVLMDN
jgi:hypothetical protein